MPLKGEAIDLTEICHRESINVIEWQEQETSLFSQSPLDKGWFNTIDLQIYLAEETGGHQ